MAEQKQQIPTFKLVLVGDGGTGKVRDSDDIVAARVHRDGRFPLPLPGLPPWSCPGTGATNLLIQRLLTSHPTDHLRQASLDW